MKKLIVSVVAVMACAFSSAAAAEDLIRIEGIKDQRVFLDRGSLRVGDDADNVVVARLVRKRRNGDLDLVGFVGTSMEECDRGAGVLHLIGPNTDDSENPHYEWDWRRVAGKYQSKDKGGGAAVFARLLCVGGAEFEAENRKGIGSRY